MKKLLFFKVVFLISIIGVIVFSLFFALYVYDINKINKKSKNLANSFSISYLYSDSPLYFANKQTEDYTDYFIIGIIKIDKLKLDYPIISEVSDELLKIAPCRFAGPLPNNVGNLCIAGHNYLDNTFFAKIRFLEQGDEIDLYGIDGDLIKYSVFNKEEIESSDFSCTSQETSGTKMITLMTCNSVKQTRIIVQASEIL